MNRYQLAVECPVCGEVIYGRHCLDTTTEPGVVLLSSFEMETFKCQECNTVVITGDVDTMYEYEEDMGE